MGRKGTCRDQERYRRNCEVNKEGKSAGATAIANFHHDRKWQSAGVDKYQSEPGEIRIYESDIVYLKLASSSFHLIIAGQSIIY